MVGLQIMSSRPKRFVKLYLVFYMYQGYEIINHLKWIFKEYYQLNTSTADR